MKIHDLIEHFSSYVKVPINPDDVALQIKKAGIADEIRFIQVDLQSIILRGALNSYVLTDGVYGEPRVYSDIYFARELDRPWRRLVCCKELLHTLDVGVSQTVGPEAVERLIDGLCSKVEIKGAGPLTPEMLQVWNDQLMIWYATAILFPQSVRELVMPVFSNGLMTVEQIATRLDLPINMVMIVLSDQWPGLYKALTGKK